MRDVLAKVVRDLIVDFHDAFLIELFGVEHAPVPPDRIQALLESGALDVDRIGGVQIPVGEAGATLDPFAYLRLLGRAYDKLGEDDALAAREWSLGDWDPHMARELAEAPVQMGLELGGRIEVGTSLPEPPAPVVEPDGAPAWMGPHEAASYKHAVGRAGAYCRGLGNTYADDASSAVYEVWDGERIEQEVEPDQRATMQAIIRERTAHSILTDRDKEKLARDLADATGYYSHNWSRIAATELQGAHNLGMVEQAIDDYGEAGRVMRVTESGACPHCLRLFRDGEGGPRVFSVRELLVNGTNVGRKAADWLPTAWPVHPNCRCDTRVVPPGFSVSADGRIRRQGGTA